MKDPDIYMLDIFVLGETQPVEASCFKADFLILTHLFGQAAHLLTLPVLLLLQYGVKKIKHMPYNHQHQYFFLGMFFM